MNRWPVILAVFYILFGGRIFYAGWRFEQFAEEHDCRMIGRTGYMNRAFVYDCRGEKVISAHFHK